MLLYVTNQVVNDRFEEARLNYWNGKEKSFMKVIRIIIVKTTGNNSNSSICIK